VRKTPIEKAADARSEWAGFSGPFSWILGVGLASCIAILNAMWFEFDADLAASQKADTRSRS